MNILITSIGRRNYLVDFFRAEIETNDRIIATDMDPNAPGLSAVDVAYNVQGVYHEDYINTILKICKLENIDLLISVNDVDLPVLAAAKSQFEAIGTTILVSQEKIIEMCFDKYKTYLFALENDIAVPKTYIDINLLKSDLEKQIISFPLIVKPRWGSGSIGLEVAHTINQVETAIIAVKQKIANSVLNQASNDNSDANVIIQQKIIGVEFGVDILNDLNGKFVTQYAKEKISMRAGETDKAVLRNVPEISALAEKLGKKLAHVGNLDCDFFKVNDQVILLEMNPRFGGGYPFTHNFGGNFIKLIINMMKEEPYQLNQLQWKYNLPMAKYDSLTFTRQPEHLVNLN